MDAEALAELKKQFEESISDEEKQEMQDFMDALHDTVGDAHREWTAPRH
jgi:hypothetical protein